MSILCVREVRDRCEFIINIVSSCIEFEEIQKLLVFSSVGTQHYDFLSKWIFKNENIKYIKYDCMATQDGFIYSQKYKSFVDIDWNIIEKINFEDIIPEELYYLYKEYFLHVEQPLLIRDGVIPEDLLRELENKKIIGPQINLKINPC